MTAGDKIIGDPFWATMDEIWAGQKARGHLLRSKAEIDASIASLRDDAEEEMLAVERIHAECRQAGKSSEIKRSANQSYSGNLSRQS
jgi:hypothetical protein